MKYKKLIISTLILTSTHAFAGNWRVNNGWCQTMSDDGQVLIMLKQGQISVMGRSQGCPNGEQILMGSNIGINGNLIRTSQVCNAQTAYRAIEVEGGQDPAAAKAAILSIAGREGSTVQVFGSSMRFTRGDMLQVCPKFVPALVNMPSGPSVGKPAQINKSSVLSMAKKAYTKEYGDEGTESADFSNYQIKGNKVIFEVFNAGFKTYDNIFVTVGPDGTAVSATVEYKGQ